MSVPYDAISALIQGVPQDSDRQLALAQSLRSQNLLGNLGLASGDRVIGPEGKSLIGQTDTSLQDILRERDADLQRKQLQDYHDAMLQQRADTAALLEQGRNSRNTANIQGREQVGAAHDTAALERAKLAAQGRGGMWTNDSEVNAVLGEHLGLFGSMPSGNYHMLPGAVKSMIDQDYVQHGYAPGDPQYQPDYHGIARQMGYAHLQQVEEQARLRNVGTTGNKIEQGASEMQILQPLIEDDMKQLGNTPIKGLNWLLNTAKNQLNDPKLEALQTDLLKLHNAYSLVSGRGGTSMYERLLQMNRGTEYQDTASLHATLMGFMQEAQMAHQVNREQRTPQITDPRTGIPIPQPGGTAGPAPGGHFVPFTPGQPRPPIGAPVQPGGAPGAATPAATQQLRPDDLAPAGMPGSPGVAPQRPPGMAQLRALPQTVPQPMPPQPQGAPQARAFPSTLGAPPAAATPRPALPQPQGGQGQLAPQANPITGQLVQQYFHSKGITELPKATDTQLNDLVGRLGHYNMGTNAQTNDVMRVAFQQVQAELQRRAQMKDKVRQDAEAFYH